MRNKNIIIVDGKEISREMNDNLVDILREYLQKLKENKKFPFMDTKTEVLENENWGKPIASLEDIKKEYSQSGRGKKYHEIEEMYVSDMGRVKFIINKESKKRESKIIEQNDNILEGYLKLTDYPGFGYVYRLVAENWIGKIPDKSIVHHIDNNGYNNKVENLIIVTPEQHARIHRLS